MLDKEKTSLNASRRRGKKKANKTALFSYHQINIASKRRRELTSAHFTAFLVW